MLEYNPQRYFPSSEELPDSDDTPVDNELQELIPGLLKAILLMLWAEPHGLVLRHRYGDLLRCR
jgi:hypothetical protein